MADSTLPDRRAEDERLRADLGPTSSTPTRISALLETGLEIDEVAEALGVTATTVRNWLRGTASPRRIAVRVVDDLRRAVVLLAEAGTRGEDAGQWLRSRQGGTLEGERPLDMIRNDPEQVLSAAAGLGIGVGEKDGADLHAVPG
jgi:transcriptional regulator with XRE-family HTH domain